MAIDKNSFVLYTDKRELIKKLVEDDRNNGTNNAGELFLHIYDYVSDLDPDPVNFTVDIAFESIRPSLKKDLKKWREKQNQRVEAGRLGGLARAENAKQNQANQATAKNSEQNQANQAVTDTVTDTDTVTANVIVNDLNKKLLSEIDISDVPPELQGYYKIALSFQNLFIENLKASGAPIKNQTGAKFGAYVDPIRLMVEVDKVTMDQIKQAYDFLKSKDGHFWKKNILSTSKLREKIEKLILEKNSNKSAGPITEMNQRVRDKIAKYD